MAAVNKLFSLLHQGKSIKKHQHVDGLYQLNDGKLHWTEQESMFITKT